MPAPRPSAALTIREAEASELDEVGRQTLEAYAQYEPSLPEPIWTPYAAELRDAAARAAKGTVLVIVRDGDLVGSATLGWDEAEPDTAHMWMLAVASQARGLGAGPAMMDEVFARSRRMGAHVLKWNTLSVMDPAIRMYRRLGYEPDSTLDLTDDLALYTYRVPLGGPGASA